MLSKSIKSVMSPISPIQKSDSEKIKQFLIWNFQVINVSFKLLFDAYTIGRNYCYL